MEPRKGARAVRAARGAVLIAAAFLGTVWAAPPEPANDRGDSLVGTLAYGKGGVIRLIVDRLPLRVPDARLQAMLVNEGAESFSVQAKDAWFATMEDGRKFAFTVVRIDNPGKLWTSLESITGKRTPRKVVLEPGDWLPCCWRPRRRCRGT